MEIVAHFNDIQAVITKELSKARFNIFVAVAWITDKSLWDLLVQKSKEGVVVQIILVNDLINNGTGVDFENFVHNGGQLYWDNHHHKFCVVDIKTVITGSYNWTYYAQNRAKRENVIVIKGANEIAEQFSDEFKLLLRQAIRFELPKEVIYIQKEVPVDRIVIKEVIKEVEKKIVERVPVVQTVVEQKVIKIRETLKPAAWYDTQEKRSFWWDKLSNNWKKIFNDAVFDNKHEISVKPNDAKLEKLFKLNRLDLTYYNRTKFQIKDLSGLENLTNLKEVIVTGHEISKKKVDDFISLNPYCKIIGWPNEK